MALNCGIIGLPNVGKSTIFSALTATPVAIANYPFCTIEPNKGFVEVPDARLRRISELVPSPKTVPAIIEFVDIAGLVKGAAEGEGLGNKFLSHIRELGLLIHVVRCFDDNLISHVSGTIDPIQDIEIIATELALADLATVARAIERYSKQLKGASSEQRKIYGQRLDLLAKIELDLAAGKAVRAMGLSANETKELAELHLITSKPQIYLCNIGEEDLHKGNSYVEAVQELAVQEQVELLFICGQLEAEIATIGNKEERQIFLDAANLRESGLDTLCKLSYKTLGLSSFFTVGGIENKAWTFPNGIKAPQAAGLIHSDFEKGFIKADVYSCDDLFALGDEAKIKSAGKMRLEGKDYTVVDGDVLFFKFNP